MSSTLFALWISFSAGLVLLFFYFAFLNLRSRQTRPVELGDLIPSLLPVNVEVFSMLVTERGAARLQNDRERVRETMDFLRRMTHNAAVLQQLGYSQVNSSNQLISELAQEMIDAGVHVRLYSFLGLITLRVWSILGLRSRPSFAQGKIAELQQMLSASLVPAYELLKNKAGNLTCLKFSGYHEALVQGL